MSNSIIDAPQTSPSRIEVLAQKLKNEKYRNAYMSRRLRAVLAAQIRAFRGPESQIAFGKRIDQTQSRVSDLENEDSGNPSLRTLIKVAQRLHVALIVQFVDYSTFLKFTDGLSPATLNPERFSGEGMDRLIKAERSANADELPRFRAPEGQKQQEPVPSAPHNRNQPNDEQSHSFRGQPEPRPIGLAA
jgi:transcriptional regulator with XRE-family HTH domain